MFGQVVWFVVKDGQFTEAAWKALPERYQMQHPVALGEALRAGCKADRPVRVESFKNDYALLWLNKTTSGDVLDTTHLVTYDGGRLHGLARKSTPVPGAGWTVEQAAAVSNFETDVRAVLGTMPSAKLSQNSIDVVVKLCRGVALRKGGGHYFVPTSWESVLYEYVKAAETLGVDTFRVDVERSQNSIVSVAKGAGADLVGRLAETVKKIGETKTARGYESRLAELAELTSVAELYEGVLSMKLDTLRGQIEQVRGAVALMIAA